MPVTATGKISGQTLLDVRDDADHDGDTPEGPFPAVRSANRLFPVNTFERVGIPGPPHAQRAWYADAKPPKIRTRHSLRLLRIPTRLLE